MSEIITAYPTSGLEDRSINSLNTAFFNYISTIPEIAEFFDSVTKLGDDTTTTATDFGTKMTKGTSFIRSQFYASTGTTRFLNNSDSTSASTVSNANATNLTSTTVTVDIPVRYTKGINDTVAVWLDEYSKGVCMVLGKFDDKYFLASSSALASTAFNYSDTGGSVSTLVPSFNGSNIGTGGDYIAQPYYHLGINTGDIYTFDGGAANIPWGKFKVGNAEFVRLFSNFALRIK